MIKISLNRVGKGRETIIKVKKEKTFGSFGGKREERERQPMEMGGLEEREDSC